MYPYPDAPPNKGTLPERKGRPDLHMETDVKIGRIISARKATRREREAYEEGHY